MSKFITMCIVLLALTTLTEKFYYIPQAALSAVIFVSINSLVNIGYVLMFDSRPILSYQSLPNSFLLSILSAQRLMGGVQAQQAGLFSHAHHHAHYFCFGNLLWSRCR